MDDELRALPLPLRLAGRQVETDSLCRGRDRQVETDSLYRGRLPGYVRPACLASNTTKTCPGNESINIRVTLLLCAQQRSPNGPCELHASIPPRYHLPPRPSFAPSTITSSLKTPQESTRKTPMSCNKKGRNLFSVGLLISDHNQYTTSYSPARRSSSIHA